MKKVLIVSPHFPPVNAADMHRVRQSLPYFENYGWTSTVLTVFPDHVEMAIDDLLQESIPESVEIHKVSAFSTTYTRKLGLGNLGIRAFWQLYTQGNKILKEEKFDLIYFSTTVFATMPLGALWKKKFRIPFIIDMQDPWRNDYYLNVPKNEQPPKFWFAYRLNKVLEKFTIPKADGLLAVSKGYVEMLKYRYPNIKNLPSKVLTFGAAVKDFEVLSEIEVSHKLKLREDSINIIYVGRGGHDMQKSLSLVFNAFKEGLLTDDLFKKCKFWFVGTSYATKGQGQKTILPIAEKIGISEFVEEITDRQPYFEVLSLLKEADLILIPGSDDKNYTASKLYPNILARKPLLCVFHSDSNIGEIVKDINAGEVVKFNDKNADRNCFLSLKKLIHSLPFTPETNWEKFKPYTAEALTAQQCDFFNAVIEKKAR